MIESEIAVKTLKGPTAEEIRSFVFDVVEGARLRGDTWSVKGWHRRILVGEDFVGIVGVGVDGKD